MSSPVMRRFRHANSSAGPYENLSHVPKGGPVAIHDCTHHAGLSESRGRAFAVAAAGSPPSGVVRASLAQDKRDATLLVSRAI